MNRLTFQFPDFFFETYAGDVFTNKSLEGCFCVVFILVTLFSKKDQHRIWLFKDLYDDTIRNTPALQEKLKFIAISSDTPSSMKKLEGDLFSFFPILAIPDKKVFEKVDALNKFSFFNIKASEPIRKAFLLHPDRTILWTWEKEVMPAIDRLTNLLTSNP
ncbi:MAG: redoxin domain-containing protein [Caldisericia bacterium]|nr:redoxin domain-containing protein [Caldisericia bacterium]MDD4614897.1 redoxin domain-containing protein [Caldisericia bacterium]